MVQTAFLDEINRHVEAVLVLSKHEILARLISEAELCVNSNQMSAAAILSGIALEELFSTIDFSVGIQSKSDVEAWLELRNRATHPVSAYEELDPNAVTAMVSGIRALLNKSEHSQMVLRPAATARELLGKYAFVPTSVDAFLRRKRQDLELENGE